MKEREEEAMRAFTLHVLPSPDGYGVEVRQRLNTGQGPQEYTVVRAVGAPFHAAVSHVLQAVRRSGYQPSDLHQGRKSPFYLKEEWGVRLSLLLMALNPLRKTSRMERIVDAIAEMSDEECYYWFSWCSRRPGRAQQSLRMLVA